MSEVYVISDLHLGHRGVLAFVTRGGERLRPFADLGQMHECIKDLWNDTVTPQDKVYVLGDVAMKANREIQGYLSDLPGKKRLVRGNHDLAKDSWYKEAGFQSIYGVRHIDGVWLTHAPMHPQCLSGRAIGNIHGHLHADYIWNIMPEQDRKGVWNEGWKDSRYFNACVENIDYRPISIDAVIEQMDWNKTGVVK